MRKIASLRVIGELGQDRGVDRLREDRVGRHDRDERELIREHAPLDTVADHDRGAEQDADSAVLEHRPRRQFEELT